MAAEIINYRNASMYLRAMELKAVSQMEKTVSLLNLMGEHHPPTQKHSHNVALLARSIASFDPKRSEQGVKKIFKVGLLHDVGKIVVPQEILSRGPDIVLNDQEGALLKAHGKIGREILTQLEYEEVYGLIADQHYIGSDIEATTKEDLRRRHQLVPYVALADLIMSLLDRSRVYQKHYTLDEVIEGVERRFRIGYFPSDLRPHFYNALDENRSLLT